MTFNRAMAHPRQGPTILDVAAECGLSKSTVAYALRNDPRIPAETAERVLQAAERLGYQRHPLYSYLGSRPSRDGKKLRTRVAYLLPQMRIAYDQKQLLEALDAEASSQGLSFSGIRVGGATDSRRLAKRLRDMGVEALVLQNRLPYADMEDFPWDQFTTLVVDGHFPIATSGVVVGEFDSLLRTLTHVHERGFRRPLLVLPWFHEGDYGDSRRAGAEFYFRSLHPDFDMPETLRLPNFRDIAPEELRRLVERSEADLVIAFNPAVQTILQRANLKIPDEMPMIFLRRRPDPRWAGWMIDIDGMAKLVIRQLLGLLQTGLRGPQTHRHEVLFHKMWVGGASYPYPGSLEI